MPEVIVRGLVLSISWRWIPQKGLELEEVMVNVPELEIKLSALAV